MLTEICYCDWNIQGGVDVKKSFPRSYFHLRHLQYVHEHKLHNRCTMWR
jgi:hypothetical protein